MTLSRCGIQYCYLKAAETKDLKLKTDLMGFVKTISYNISANTWPVWGDKGITISAENRLTGLDCAKTNLRLAVYLNKDYFPMGNAHWLLGAHYMVEKDYTRAILSLMKARSAYKRTGKAEYILMAQGYLAITELVKKPTREGGANIMSVVVKLKALDTDDANFFASQIETVLKYMSKITKKK